MASLHRISNLTPYELILHNLDVWSYENRTTTCGPHYLDNPKVDVTESQISATQVAEDKIISLVTKNQTQEQISSPAISSERIISFAGPSSIAMSKVPLYINEDVISDMYLRLQLNTIDETLSQLSNAEFYSYERPLVEYQQRFRPLIGNPFWSGNNKVFLEHVVKQALEIQSVMRTNSGSVSIQLGAWEMFNLSTALHNLDMFEEAATIGLWTVNLFRTLVSLDSAIYLPYLIHSLRHLSIFYIGINNLDAAQDAITESVGLSRTLQTPTAAEELKVQFAGCLRESSLVFTRRGKHEKALQDAYAALEILNGIIIEKVDQDDPVERAFILSALGGATFEYAQVLHTLSVTLENMGLVADAAKNEINALGTFRLLSPWDLNGPIQADIAGVLARLAGQNLRPFITLEEAYSYSKESEKIYRKLFKQNSKKYGKSLCGVLWEQADILGSLDREEDALKVSREMANIAREAIEDRIYVARALCQLSRSFRCPSLHDQADSTLSESTRMYEVVLKTRTEIEADTYYKLAVDLHLAGAQEEALQVAENAILQYRTLALQDADQHTKKLAHGLNLLVLILIHAVQYKRALHEAYEAVKLHETLVQTDSTLLSEYLRALRLNLSVAERLNDPERPIERGEYIVGLSREFVKKFPDEEWHAVASMSHSCILAMHDRLPDALRSNQEALEWYQSHSPKDANAAAHHVECLINQGNFWDHSGYPERALEFTQQAIIVGKTAFLRQPCCYLRHRECDVSRWPPLVSARAL